MADPTFPDEWLAHSLEGVLSAERLAELRAKATPGRTLWETLVDEKIASDQQILSALSTRFRLRSEEHTSELQSQSNLVCRLLLEKKKLFRSAAHVKKEKPSELLA